MSCVKQILCSLAMVVGSLAFGETVTPSTPTNVIVNAGEILEVASGSTFAANDVTIGSVITLTAHMKADSEGYIIELWNGNEKTYDSGLIYLDEGQEWVTKTYAVTNVPYTTEKLLWWGEPCYMGETISSSRLNGVVRMDVTSQIAFSGKWFSTGRLDVHMEDATEPSYKIVDYLGEGTMTREDYGRVYKFKAPALYKPWVFDNDLFLCKSATLSNVASVAEGVTNATVVVKAGGTMIEPNADGTYTVPQDVPLTIDYTAIDGYVFDYWKTSKTVELAPLYDDYTLTAAEKPVIADRWADARIIDLDTREKIVVTDLSEILPIAYSTNFWGSIGTGGRQSTLTAALYVNDGLLFTSGESGYAQWRPEAGAYGKYNLKYECLENGAIRDSLERTIYYSAPYRLTIQQPSAGGTLVVTNGTEEVESGDVVLAYYELSLAATPDKNWQLEAFIKDGVPMSGNTFEMPLANVTLGASFVVSDAYVATATNDLVAAAAEVNDYLKTILSGTDLVAATNDVADARSVCMGVLLECKTPAAVDEALKTAIALLNAVKNSHSKFEVYSHVITFGGRYDTEGGSVAVTNEASVESEVLVKAMPNADWQFNGWSGAYVMAGVTNTLVFGDETAASTDFIMPVGEVTLTATFALSEDYRKQALATVQENYTTASGLIERMPLTLEEQEAAQSILDQIRTTAMAAISSAVRPEGVSDALVNQSDALVRLIEDCETTAEARARFYAPMVIATEGNTFKVAILGGSTNVNTAVSLSIVKNTYHRSVKFFLDGKRVTLPIQLTWEAGDREPKMLTVRLDKSTRAKEADRFLTLQLGSTVSMAEGSPMVCTVRIDDQTGSSDSLPYVRALAWPANGGKVMGSGTLSFEKSRRTLSARANRWATFSGWYAAKADYLEEPDLEKGLVTEAKKLKVTQADAGTYYAVFTDVMPVVAVRNPGNQVLEKGIYVEIPVEYTASEDDKKARVLVSGLPSGLKYDRKRSLIYGTPKRTGAKIVKIKGYGTAGYHQVEFTVMVR